MTARFALAEGEHARLDIYDCGGRRVRRLIDGDLAPGDHEITWDGTDERGRRAPVGVYFVELTRPAGRQGLRIVRLR
jgi:flagellar hook assembly protein FlgD